jgi:hypothetical protein
VQGQLRDKKLSVTIDTECAHCGQPMQITLTSDLDYQVREPDAAPVVYIPIVNFAKLRDPSIIDAF